MNDIWQRKPAGLVLGLDFSGGRKDSCDGKTVTLNNGAAIIAGNRFVSLDGVNDFLSVSDDPSLSFGNAGTDQPFSVSCWVNPSTYSSTAITYLVSKGGAAKYEWTLALNCGSTSTNGPGFFLYNAAASAYVARIRNSRFSTTGAWAFFVSTYSGGKTTGSIKLYQDAVQIDNTSLSGGAYAGLTDNNGPVEIGAWEGVGLVNGSMAGVRIYNREITQPEIAQIYNAGAARLALGGTP